MPDRNNVHEIILKVIASQSGNDSNLQSGSVLRAAARELFNQQRESLEDEQALLTQLHDFFRTGYLAWGYNIMNPNPPFFHLTEKGRKTLANFSRDPGNPSGYMNRIVSIGQINPIAKSYLVEALDCYVSDLNKAGAVMIGGASESLLIELRDSISDKLTTLGKPVPKDILAWQAARMLAGLKAVLDTQRLPNELKAEYESFWPAFTQQIRAARNDAGHPSAIDPITTDTLHASLLIFPELLKLQSSLVAWVRTSLT